MRLLFNRIQAVIMEENIPSRLNKKRSRLLRFSRFMHKWPAVVIAFLALIFAFSGIILNHRNIFSSIDIPRNLLPSNYRYENWNLAAVRGSLPLSNDSVLVYGNIGVWLTNGEPKSFTGMNEGFPKGIDNRKIYSLVKFKGNLVAATHFGLYTMGKEIQRWEKKVLPVKEERLADLAVKGDTLLVLTRHHLLKTYDLTNFEAFNLPEPIGYERKTGLFNTLWELHSGELFGLAGKLFVDLLGLVTILLSITGIIHFFIPAMMRKKKAAQKSAKKLASTARKNIRWHNVVGYLFIVFLVINVTAGTFLRPPFLIAIANNKVPIFPYSHLDDDNPWHDKLRRISWNDSLGIYLFSTSEGFHVTDESLRHPMVPISPQPPVSVMGCNVLEQTGRSDYLVGSFNGLFHWNLEDGSVSDFFTGMPVNHAMFSGRPIGTQMVTGMVRMPSGTSWWYGYDIGAAGLLHEQIFPAMPGDLIKETPLSLWNVALEMHTGRIFEFLLGPFYILIVPLTGLSLVLVLISGFIIWWKAYRKR